MGDTISPPASPIPETDRPHLPTDSMVTVRLSGVRESQLLSQDITEESCHESQTDPEPRRGSIGSQSSMESERSNQSSEASVDWEGLEKTEKQEPKGEGSDDSTALLLARLEEENAALATNPKSGLSQNGRGRAGTRPPSMQQLKKMVNGPQRQSLRYSLLPAPAMTELEFWAALVSDYRQTAQRLPTLTSNKLRGGVPPPLRGVVWPSISGARDPDLLEEYNRLCNETSPYEGLIGKDVGRSFPNVEMFRDPQGEGQQMLSRVLKSFSLYDQKIGYCQGLGFVVGPLLMHMGEAEAFCVLVRLMEHYDLRSCYLPDLSGLHLRIYQFQSLLSRHVPELATHLDNLKVEPLYVSQWFLSFFAVTCPLPMLLRIYDIILSEGATETLMRVALSLMRRNQKKIEACTEFEDAMQLLLSRSLWDTYSQHADDMVADFTSLTSLVTRESLQTLETAFKDSQSATKLPSLKAAASQLLGRFWAGSSHGSSKSMNALSIPSRPMNTLQRQASKQSLASTLGSFDTISDASTAVTDLSSLSRKSDTSDSTSPGDRASASQNKDKDLHSQIEDLLTALSDLQRDQAALTRDLQKEREERSEDAEVARELLAKVKEQSEAAREILDSDEQEDDIETADLIQRAEERYSARNSKRISIHQTKHQLRDAATEWKEKHELESGRCQDLMQRLDESEKEHTKLKEQLREARSRIQESHREKQRFEKTIQDLRRRSPKLETPSESVTSSMSETDSKAPPKTGLREFKLGRVDTASSTTTGSATTATTVFSKRTSSLMMQPVLSTEDHKPAAEDALLLELVNAKTAEAMAKQELEEVKGKLDALRKMVGGRTPSPSTRPGTIDSGISQVSTNPSMLSPKTPSESPKAIQSNFSGGFFSGWGKRSVSNVG
ncbi:MAG: hypothetical protein Q9227_005589 [Pyrenula ochraceoflavens]